nr:autotransporter outer membrane beta-barrel domain-containing protein [uncultured Cohaesibacter sp.]
MRLRHLAFVFVCSASLLPQLAHSASSSNAGGNGNQNSSDNANCHASWLNNCEGEDTGDDTSNSGGDDEASDNNTGDTGGTGDSGNETEAPTDSGGDDTVIVDQDDPTDTDSKQAAGTTVASTTTAANTAIGGLVGQMMSASGTNGFGGGMPSGGGSDAKPSHVSSYVVRLSEEPGVSAITSTYGDGGQPSLAPLDRYAWIKPMGGWSRKEATANGPSAEAAFGGMMSGMDIYSDAFYRLGVIGALARVNVSADVNDSHVQMTLAKVGLTNSVEWGHAYFDNMLLYGPEFTHTKRSVVSGGTQSLMTSDYTNQRVTNAFEVGYRTVLSGVVIQPSAGVQLDWVYQDEAREKGLAGAAIYTKASSYWNGNTKLGVNLSTAFFLGDYALAPSLGAYWIHRFGQLSGTSMMSFDSGSTYQAMGEAPIRDVTKLQTGLTLTMKSNVSLSANYAVSFTAKEQNHAANLGFRYRF